MRMSGHVGLRKTERMTERGASMSMTRRLSIDADEELINSQRPPSMDMHSLAWGGCLLFVLPDGRHLTASQPSSVEAVPSRPRPSFAIFVSIARFDYLQVKTCRGP